jgi:hypothetical protein
VSSLIVSWRRLGPTLFAAATLALLCGCASVGSRSSSTLQPGAATTGDSTLFVIRRSWHIDVAFAAEDLTPPLATVRSDFPDARYLGFGFGDRHYLLHPGGLSMLEALWPGPGLVLATGLIATPEEAFGGPDVIRLSVSRAQQSAVQDFIWQALTQREGRVSPLQAGPYSGSFYYESPQRYSAVHTCNTWAAEALKSAGLSITSDGVEFAGELWAQVDHLHTEQQTASR